MTTVPILQTKVGRSSAPPHPGRTLGSYLLVPRPKDLVKAIVLPLSFGLAAAGRQQLSWGMAGRALLVWVALELLVYQARYQWNDIRGFDADQAHPESASRGRLPGPAEKGRSRKAASASVAVLKLLLTAALAAAVPELAPLLLVMTVAVFGVAAVYERLRTSATGRSSEVPVPLRPSLVGLWVFVGAGYAVRALTGVALAIDLSTHLSVAVAAGVCAWALGVVFVTCRWTLEAMCFGTLQGDRMVWQARSSQAREHTLGLVRWLPEDASAATGRPCGWRALQGRTSLAAPWHLALLVAAASAGVTGGLLDGTSSPAVAVVAGAAALAVAALPGSRLLAAVAGGLLLGSAFMAVGATHPVLALLPWLTTMVLYGCFTRQCADEIGQPLRRFRPSAR